MAGLVNETILSHGQPGSERERAGAEIQGSGYRVLERKRMRADGAFCRG